MDFCITIRTMLIKNKKIFVQAGAGIVADSKPDREYQETVNKALGMVKAIQKAQEGIENAFND
jgi:anthranilate synthase component 1